MGPRRIIYRVHAVRRMFERGFTEKDIDKVLAGGETIEVYIEDQPYPSRLVSGIVGNRPVHVVIAENVVEGETIVITVYEPDARRWHEDFKTRRAT